MVNIQSVDVDQNLNPDKISKVYATIAKDEGFEIGDISLVLGGDEWLLKYNKEYLNHDFYTDIITFDYVEKNIISGDLLLSLERIEDNANSLNVSRETELNRVIIHGFLHLCGYKDETDAEKQIMRKKEDYYLKLL